MFSPSTTALDRPVTRTRVLLVEDNALHSQLIRTILGQSPFDVVAVNSLTDAFHELESADFDAILLDLELPDSDGLSTLAAVVERARDSAIVVITAHDDAKHALEAVASGAADYLVKGKLDAQTMMRSIRYSIERKRAELKLLSSEARFRAIIESSLDAVVGMSIDGRITSWNRRAETMFGFSASEAIGAEVAELIIPEGFRERHRRAIARYRDTGISLGLLDRRVEFVAMRRDGSEFPTEMSITSFESETGVEFSAFISDITVRRQLENAREELSRRFRALVEHSADGISLVDREGKVIYSSPAVTRILGYPAEEFLGVDVFELAHPDDAARARAKFQECIAGAPPEVVQDLRFRHRDGSWRFLNIVRSNCLDDPAIGAIVINMRDTTDIRRSREALHSLSVKHEVILNSVGDGIFGIDCEDRITFANPAASRMLGFDVAGFEGQLLHPVVHAAGADVCPIRATLADGEVRQIENDRFCRRDGGSLPVSYTVAPIRDQAESIIGAVVSFADVTKQREMEGQIEQAMRVSSLGRVAASVAHEFNNVLMAIQPFAELLQKRVGGEDNVQRPVRHILDAIKRGQRMTTQILRFTRPSEPSMETFDAAAWMRGFSEEARPMLPDRRVEVDAGANLLVRADLMQLHQVFINFVANARHATTSGDLVTFGAQSASDVPFVSSQISDAGGHIVLFVRDEGKGIPPHVLPRIFEPLYTTKRGGGTGLGLAVAQQVITHHSGRILVETQQGEGTTFYVVLPIERSVHGNIDDAAVKTA